MTNLPHIRPNNECTEVARDSEVEVVVDGVPTVLVDTLVDTLTPNISARSNWDLLVVLVSSQVAM